MKCMNCTESRAKHKGDRCPDGTGFFKEPSCPYQVRKATQTKVGLHCGRMTDGETAYCPKHRVMVEGEKLENEKKMQKLRDRKAFKGEMRKALETSPLRGYNPDADKRRGAYSA